MKWQQGEVSYGISIHALLAESDLEHQLGGLTDASISIHALLAESDCTHRLECRAIWNISIHALLAESDAKHTEPSSMCTKFLSTLSLRRATLMWYQCNTVVKEFLSTLSLRRATKRCSRSRFVLCHFYPRSPCGERRHISALGGACLHFYPRSPCGERPEQRPAYTLCAIQFLSTLSLRRATAGYTKAEIEAMDISIHALLAESDRTMAP